MRLFCHLERMEVIRPWQSEELRALRKGGDGRPLGPDRQARGPPAGLSIKSWTSVRLWVSTMHTVKCGNLTYFAWARYFGDDTVVSTTLLTHKRASPQPRERSFIFLTLFPTLNSWCSSSNILPSSWESKVIDLFCVSNPASLFAKHTLSL